MSIFKRHKHDWKVSERQATRVGTLLVWFRLPTLRSCPLNPNHPLLTRDYERYTLIP